VFGPIFTSMGTLTSGANGVDSSSTNTYPHLMGGGDFKPSTRIEGVGIVPPSKNYTLTTDGSLPTAAQTGSDPSNKYLPGSRVPGDQDLISDPYRVSQSYLASRGSYKAEPAPFLTNFSAFQK
jgi:hypothetical protein